MSIDPGRPIPLYFQLKTLLLEDLLGGRYGPGDRLPTEHELCETFGISRTPVSRALSELADEGVVLRHRGRGTFVNPHWAPRGRDRGEIRIVVPQEGPWERIVRGAAPADLDVNVVAVPRADLHHMLTHAVADGLAPDLAVLDSVWVPEFAAAGFLHGLDELDQDWVQREHKADFLPPLLTATLWDGRTFAVSAVADVAGLWYWRDQLDSRGLDPPRTWSDLLAVGRRFAGDGLPFPIVMPAGSRGGETTAYCLIALLASNGASVLGERAVSLDSVAAVQAVQFVRQLVDERLLAQESVGYDWNRPIRLLGHRQAAISFGGSYEAGTLAHMLGMRVHDLADEVGFVAVPAGPMGFPASVTGTMVYGIFRQAADPKQAMRLLEHVVAPDALARVAQATGRIPPRRSAIALAAAASPFVAMTAEILEHAVTRPATPVYPRVSAQLAAMLEAVLTDRLTAPAAVRRTAEMVGAITGLPVLHDLGATPRAAPIG
jgi:multiple sugar transport system substrate-binding protein